MHEDYNNLKRENFLPHLSKDIHQFLLRDRWFEVSYKQLVSSFPWSSTFVKTFPVSLLLDKDGSPSQFIPIHCQCFKNTLRFQKLDIAESARNIFLPRIFRKSNVFDLTNLQYTKTSWVFDC